MTGIDVSVHNGYVDFKKVKAAGYDFPEKLKAEVLEILGIIN